MHFTILFLLQIPLLLQLCSTMIIKPINNLKPSVQNFDNTIKNQDNFNPNGNLMDKVENSLDGESSVEDDKDKAVAADDDMLETAENIVFRPLFRYKKQRVTKKKIYKEQYRTTTKAPTNYYDNYDQYYRSTTQKPINYYNNYNQYYQSTTQKPYNYYDNYDQYYRSTTQKPYNYEQNYKNSPPKFLVYDYKTHSYYPITGYYGY